MSRLLSTKLALALIVPAGAAHAQSTADMATFRANCGSDYVRLCAGMSPGGSEVRTCFSRNRAKLSDGCAAAIDAYEARQAATPVSR